jgi:8-oxo-dGTP pyrophosphatase MutT (NUDIX family)
MQNIVRARNEGERKIIPNGEPVILSEGRIGAIVRYPVLVDRGNGYVEDQFERFVRPPGTRIIAIRNNKIFLQKEYRQETETFDWRLPGGKVLDTFSDYKKYLSEEIPEEMIIEAGRRELLEEAQLKAASMAVFKKSSCGASVTWDLYYLIARDIVEVSHTHNEGEEIVESEWFSFSEILTLCRENTISEDRTVSALFQFIESLPR